MHTYTGTHAWSCILPARAHLLDCAHALRYSPQRQPLLHRYLPDLQPYDHAYPVIRDARVPSYLVRTCPSYLDCSYYDSHGCHSFPVSSATSRYWNTESHSDTCCTGSIRHHDVTPTHSQVLILPDMQILIPQPLHRILILLSRKQALFLHTQQLVLTHSYHAQVLHLPVHRR